MKRIFFIFFVSVLSLPSARPCLASDCGKIAPADEANKDTSFLFFRERLLKALQEKDAASLRPFLAAQAQTSIGSKEAPAKNYLTQWTEENPGHDFWKEMETVLNLGGAFENPKTFTAPYVSALWAKATLCDPSEAVAVLEKDQAVSLAPKSEALPLTTLSYSIVSVENVPGNVDWVQVKLDSGKTGYLPRTAYRSPLDYRAVFKKEKGVWLLTSFVAGD